jgi:hypothetical protein
MNYKLLNARRKSQAEAAAQNWLAVLISAPQGPQPPNPPSHGVQKGGRGANYQSISDVVLFRLRLNNLSLLLLHLGKSLKTAGLMHDFCCFCFWNV